MKCGLWIQKAELTASLSKHQYCHVNFTVCNHSTHTRPIKRHQQTFISTSTAPASESYSDMWVSLDFSVFVSFLTSRPHWNESPLRARSFLSTSLDQGGIQTQRLDVPGIHTSHFPLAVWRKFSGDSGFWRENNRIFQAEKGHEQKHGDHQVTMRRWQVWS